MASRADLPDPANPTLLVCDTDALAQILIAGNVSVLRDLKKVYRVQPSIVEAVEFELRCPQSRTLRRLQAKYEPALEKALGNGTIQIADERSLPAYVGAAANAVWTEIAIRATAWAFRVQRGEAYSHSLALSLRLPILTHDKSAVRTLQTSGETLTRPLLRAFDLYALGFQRESMTESDCEQCRKILEHEKEFLPDAFRHRSFIDGLPYFYPRLQCASVAAVGHPTPLEIDDVRLVLTPVQLSQPTQ